MTVAPDPDVLSDAQWARLAPLMPGGCKGKRGPRTDNRLFMDAVLWMTRAGGRWKDLPDRDCQEFRVEAAIVDPKEVSDGTTQSTPHP
ncbi:transposase [Methylobacterium sp. WL12]|nr:transposase [Methylobacterium sp. WL12]